MDSGTGTLTISSHAQQLTNHTQQESAPGTPDASTILRQFMAQLQQEQQATATNNHIHTATSLPATAHNLTAATTSATSYMLSPPTYGTIQPYRFNDTTPISLPTLQQQQQILGLDDSINLQQQQQHEQQHQMIHDIKPMIRDLQFDPHEMPQIDGDEMNTVIKPRRKRRKKFSPMDEAEAKALRTKKHSEAEVRRRHKFNELLVDLAKMFNCEKSQKIDILKTVISDVENMRARLAIYEQRHGILPSMDGDVNGTEDGHEQQHNNGQQQPETSRSGDEDGGLDGEQSEQGESITTLQTQPPQQQQQSQGRITIQSSLLAMDPSTAQAAATQNMLVAMSQHQQRRTQQQMQTGPSHDPSAVNMIVHNNNNNNHYPLQPSTSEDSYGIIPQHRHMSSNSPIDHRALFISSNIAMDVADLSGRIIDCNTHFCELLGYTKSSLLAPSNFFRITHPDSLAHTFAVLSSLLTGGHTAQRSRRKYITRTGHVTEVMITCWLTRDQDQQPQYVAEIVEPI